MIKKVMPKELTSKEVMRLIIDCGLFERVISIIGHGKEASIVLAQSMTDEIVVAKVFRHFSPIIQQLKKVARKRKDKLKPSEFAEMAAKQEFNALRMMHAGGVPVPRPIERHGVIVVMEAILEPFSIELNTKLYQNTLRVAPQLSQVDLLQLGDPLDYLEMALDLLYHLFATTRMVHGDFSAQNLLMQGDRLRVIDVRQANRYNIKTFTTTPVRMRVDHAWHILKTDVKTILSHFQKKYRMTLDIEDVLPVFRSCLPKHLQAHCESVENTKFRIGGN